MAEDLRERIARRLEAEARRQFPTKTWVEILVVEAVAKTFETAAQIARETPIEPPPRQGEPPIP